jgi:formylglycine-generating enzyme required for sulfatase activity/class 3 adenylate cyclase
MPTGDGSSHLVRRLAAILCGDIVGYSRLMGVDEEGTHARVTHHRREIIEPTIAEHHGRIVKHTGDGFLAMFDSPLEATRCAIVIQQSVSARNMSVPEQSRVQYRMGVNLGDVIVDNDDIYGDGVNIASRLETSATPGTVNISGGVYEQIKNKLVCGYQSLGDEKLKNITDPVRIYRVLPDPAAVSKVSKRSGRWKGVATAILLMMAGGSITYVALRERPTTAARENQPVVAQAPAVIGQPQPVADAPAPPPAPTLPAPALPEPVVLPAPTAAPAEPAPVRTATLPPPSTLSPPGPTENRDCGNCPEMVKIRAGTFSMGSNDDASEKPTRQVTVKAFAISRYPVTVREWKACAAAQGCKYQVGGEDESPVRNVSYNDAQEYVKWLSKVTGQPYRLPSEAEWEYAARAGSTTPYSWGRQMMAGIAHCKACGQGAVDGPAPVGRFAANAFGLHDMVGSVAQWTADCWHKDYNGAPRDGSAWDAPQCRERVLRGGSWMSTDAADLRVTNRAYYEAGVRYPAHGLRVVRAAKEGG